MKELIGYVIASSLDAKQDTMSLVDPVIYFNISDALSQKQDCEVVLSIKIPYPQNGKGTF